jgi:hypothetical protein
MPSRLLQACREFVQGKGFAFRSPQWPRVRREHLAKEPRCRWCGGSVAPEVHHIIPFHLDRSRELDPTNLITLCEAGTECHLDRGHFGNWKRFNLFIRMQCDMRKG